MKRVCIIGLIITFVCLLGTASISQEDRKIELNAQGILARVDKFFEYPKGLLKGMIKHIRPDGSAMSISFTGCVFQEDFLFTFNSRERGNQMKVLYNLGGEDIWVYNIHELKLFHKMGIDKFDSLLATNYSFLDLSNADFQSNYTATITGEAVVKGSDVYTLVLKPIAKGGEYGMITLYVTKDRFMPLRIDYHDRDKAIFKFMSIVKVREGGSRVIPVRYDMMNIRQGTVTIFNISEIDESASFNPEIFRPERLGD
jgi:outer membrane lipoprotein-sorting protein